jgi:hypothetical protein
MQNRQHKLENLITGLVLIPGKGQLGSPQMQLFRQAQKPVAQTVRYQKGLVLVLALD